ncbi:hypothetical protein N9Y00_07000 [Tateyamaria sp.]|nr:hypothetical protein [Tateyamaria sp.]
MNTIQIAPETWVQALPALLMVHENADSREGKQQARRELTRMAFLADQFGKSLCIEVYAMQDLGERGSFVADFPEEVNFYALMVRCEGEDPIEEFEGLGEYPSELIQQLQQKYPGASFSEIGG